MTLQQILPYAVPLLIMAVVFLRRSRRPARHLRPGRLWVVPVLVGLIILFGLFFSPHSAFGTREYLLMAVAMGGGGLFGWLRARSVDLHLHPEDGRVMMTTGNAALAVLLVLFLLRRLLTNWAQGQHIEVGLLTDLGLVFGLGLIFAQRIEL